MSGDRKPGGADRWGKEEKKKKKRRRIMAMMREMWDPGRNRGRVR